MSKNKRFLVLPRTQGIMKEGIKVNGKTRSFKGKTALYIKDSGEANEIEQTVGMGGTQEVFVYPDDKVTRFVRDGGVEGRGIHHFHFGSNSLYREGWERIFGKEE
jgi:hypothetical protein